MAGSTNDARMLQALPVAHHQVRLGDGSAVVELRVHTPMPWIVNGFHHTTRTVISQHGAPMFQLDYPRKEFRRGIAAQIDRYVRCFPHRGPVARCRRRRW